jgi:flavin-dependent dehydrogenase
MLSELNETVEEMCSIQDNFIEVIVNCLPKHYERSEKLKQRMIKMEFRMNALEEKEKETTGVTKLLKTLKSDAAVYDQDYVLHANQSRSLLSRIGSIKRKRKEQDITCAKQTVRNIHFFWWYVILVKYVFLFTHRRNVLNNKFKRL